MNLFEQRWQEESQKSKVDDILEKFYSSLDAGEKVKLRNRIIRMDPEVLYCQEMLNKTQTLEFEEQLFISEQITLKTPVEQIMFYIDAPKESATQTTREDLRKRWIKEDLELNLKGEKDFSVRTQTFIASYGVLLAALPALSKLAAHAAPNPITIGMRDSFIAMENWSEEKIGTLNPLLKFGGAVFFMAALYKRYQSQKMMDEVVLSKKFDPQNLNKFIKNNSDLEPLLQKIPPSEQVLLQHLVSNSSDERLRLFLIADKEGRSEILKRYPPSFQQRLDNLFRRYHIQDHGRNALMTSFSIPKRVIELAALQLLPADNVTDRFLTRLSDRRQAIKLPSPSNSNPSFR